MDKTKINLSTTTVIKEGTVEIGDKTIFTCRDVETCYNIDCDMCIFDGDRVLSIRELKKIIITD